MPCPLRSAAWWTDKGTGYSYTVAVAFQVRQLPLLPLPVSPCQLQSKHSAANLQCRQNTLSESVCGMMNAWRARSPRVMQGAGSERRDGQWGCEGESLLAICVWGRAAVRVDNKFDNHTILPTRLRSSQLDSDSLCMRCLTG